MVLTNEFRKRGLAGRLVVMFLAALFLSGCGSDRSDNVYTRDDHNNTDMGFTAESTEENSHLHTIWIWYANLSNPPANGALYTSSDASGHNHAIFLSEQQLTEMNNGNTEIVTSSIVQDHFHTWVLSRGTGSSLHGAALDQRIVREKAL